MLKFAPQSEDWIKRALFMPDDAIPVFHSFGQNIVTLNSRITVLSFEVPYWCNGLRIERYLLQTSDVNALRECGFLKNNALYDEQYGVIEYLIALNQTPWPVFLIYKPNDRVGFFVNNASGGAKDYAGYVQGWLF